MGRLDLIDPRRDEDDERVLPTADARARQRLATHAERAITLYRAAIDQGKGGALCDLVLYRDEAPDKLFRDLGRVDLDSPVARRQMRLAGISA